MLAFRDRPLAKMLVYPTPFAAISYNAGQADICNAKVARMAMQDECMSRDVLESIGRDETYARLSEPPAGEIFVFN